MPAGQPFTLLCQKLARPRTRGRADLHIHSTYSDGTYTPGQIVELACRSGLSAIAITDHDTTAGLRPLQEAARDSSLEVIAGVEITAEYHGQELHLLGYFFRADDKALQAALSTLQADRVGRFHEMVARLRLLRVHLPDEMIASTVTAAGTLGRRNLAVLLVRAGKAATVSEAFQRFLGDRGPAVVPKRRLPVGEAIGLVRGAGGVAAWAHPTYDCTKVTLDELRDVGMQAIEVDFPSCRPSQSRQLRAWAAELGMAISGGSDCHGPEPAGRGVGIHGVTAAELTALRPFVTG